MQRVFKLVAITLLLGLAVMAQITTFPPSGSGGSGGSTAPQLCEVKNASQGGSGASGFSIPTQANQPIATAITGTNVSTGATRFIAGSTTVQFACTLDAT